MAEPLLSVCVPIFNQADHFREQVSSLKAAPLRAKQAIEFVVVDDCSTDDLQPALAQMRADGWALRDFRNSQNLGRAASLARAVRSASGRFVAIMDGDDPFVEDGIVGIHDELLALEEAGNDCLGVVFGTVIDNGVTVRCNPLPDGLRSTLLALRADHGISGDLKEVVRRDALVGALCPLFETHRRVPTSLLWARISDLGQVRCSAKIVVRKSYQPGGLTRNLDAHRRTNVAPLLALYEKIAQSRSYRSWRYRLRAAVNFHRFQMWQREDGLRFRGDFLGLAAMLGIAIGLFERAKWAVGRTR